MHSLNFCKKFNSEQLLFEVFFDIITIFCSVKIIRTVRTIRTNLQNLHINKNNERQRTASQILQSYSLEKKFREKHICYSSFF